MDSVVHEVLHGEDLGGDDTDWFGVGGVERCFVDEAGDEFLGEDVEAID